MKKKQLERGWYSHSLPKTLRIMRLTLGLLLVLVAQGWATKSYSQRAVLNLDMKNVKLIDVLNEIENQTDYYFLFNYEQIQSDRKIDIRLTDSQINETLDYLLKETNLQYLIKDRQIVISKEKIGVNNSTQQQKKVSGKVTDPTGQPLPGVTIIIKGTSNGTITDFDGKFSLNDVPGDATLLFSFVGMSSQEVIVNGKSEINITMIEDAIGIG